MLNHDNIVVIKGEDDLELTGKLKSTCVNQLLSGDEIAQTIFEWADSKMLMENLKQKIEDELLSRMVSTCLATLCIYYDRKGDVQITISNVGKLC